MSNKFDALTTEQEEFLLSYIKHSGNLHEVIDDVSIPGNNGWEQLFNANIIWLDIQKTLGVPNKNYESYMPQWPHTSKKSPTASEIVRADYYHSCLTHNDTHHFKYACLTNNDCTEIGYLCYEDGIVCRKSISRNQYERMREKYHYEVLDLIITALIENMGVIQKGSQSGKNAFAVGTIAYCYKTNVLDKMQYPSDAGKLPVYYAILESAGIIRNEKNTISLTNQFAAVL